MPTVCSACGRTSGRCESCTGSWIAAPAEAVAAQFQVIRPDGVTHTITVVTEAPKPDPAAWPPRGQT